MGKVPALDLSELKTFFPQYDLYYKKKAEFTLDARYINSRSCKECSTEDLSARTKFQ